MVFLEWGRVGWGGVEDFFLLCNCCLGNGKIEKERCVLEEEDKRQIPRFILDVFHDQKMSPLKTGNLRCPRKLNLVKLRQNKNVWSIHSFCTLFRVSFTISPHIAVFTVFMVSTVFLFVTVFWPYRFVFGPLDPVVDPIVDPLGRPLGTASCLPQQAARNAHSR